MTRKLRTHGMKTVAGFLSEADDCPNWTLVRILDKNI